MKSQKERIREHLQRGGRLTPLQALQRFGCMTLSQRVGELKREGYRIGSWMRLVRTKNGHKRVAEYWMQMQ